VDSRKGAVLQLGVGRGANYYLP